MIHYENVCLESISYTLPEEIVTSAEIEARLAPLYERLRMPEGRLELITGVRSRRFWSLGSQPSDISVESAEKAILAAKIDRQDIGVLIHASVCRDFLEPATACSVHHRLGLSRACQIFDLSNACLGMLNGIVQVANMIELGQARAGLVVGTESARPLVETTIAELNKNTSLSRDDIKLAVASLTIGSGSSAVLVTHRELSQSGNRLIGGAARANTDFHGLCHSSRDEAGGDRMRPLMTTDSERLMREGIAAGTETLEEFLREMNWSREDIDKTFCHQVGTMHRRKMFEAMQLDLQIDYPTIEYLGNTGSVALPTAMAIGIETDHVQSGDRIALLGIGSGINCLMLGVDWQQAPLRPRPSTAKRSMASQP
ncbi:MAG: 3-oxoacyl-ACP synthase III [Pirellulales bacterium]